MNKFCIIGMGFIYTRHCQAIESIGGSVVLTCDIDPSKNPDFTDWEEMMESEKFKEIDTVVICTPNYLHAPMAIAAKKRGKTVLCEKPLCIDPLDTKFLKEINTVLQLRLSPEVNKLKEWEPNFLEFTLQLSRDEKYWNGWKGDNIKSGGLLYNLAIHYVDVLIYILGEPLRIISSEGNNYNWHKFEVQFKKGIGKLWIGADTSKVGIKRNLYAVKGNESRLIELSNKENLSYEDLHKEVYKKLLKGDGIQIEEAQKSLFLVDKIIKHGQNS